MERFALFLVVAYIWLTALRREGHMVGAGTFLKTGALVMPLALLPALAVLR